MFYLLFSPTYFALFSGDVSPEKLNELCFFSFLNSTFSIQFCDSGTWLSFESDTHFLCLLTINPSMLFFHFLFSFPLLFSTVCQYSSLLMRPICACSRTLLKSFWHTNAWFHILPTICIPQIETLTTSVSTLFHVNYVRSVCVYEYVHLDIGAHRGLKRVPCGQIGVSVSCPLWVRVIIWRTQKTFILKIYLRWSHV